MSRRSWIGLFAWFAFSTLFAPGALTAAEVGFPVPIEKYGEIRYYSMGVGAEERRQLPQLYPLKLVFRTDRGHMLCGAEVTVRERGRSVFRGSAINGPWMVIDLPPGRYDIEAVQDGRPRSVRGVRIEKGKRRAVTMSWGISEVKMGLPEPARKGPRATGRSAAAPR